MITIVSETENDLSGAGNRRSEPIGSAADNPFFHSTDFIAIHPAQAKK